MSKTSSLGMGEAPVRRVRKRRMRFFTFGDVGPFALFSGLEIHADDMAGRAHLNRRFVAVGGECALVAREDIATVGAG